MSIDEVLDRLEAAENEFAGRELMAPVVGPEAGPAAGRAEVAVRIAGVICRLRTIDDLPRGFRGWAILRALSTSRARFVGEAGLAQVAAYLALFPVLKLLTLRLADARWLCMAAHAGDLRFSIQGVIPLELPEEGLEPLETVIARFDGRQFWYERRDPGRDPAVAAYLRNALGDVGRDGLPPEARELQKRGLTPEERAAYDWLRKEKIEEIKDQAELRLREALKHAGAHYRSHAERPGVFVVRYEVDGQEHVSTVDRGDLSVIAAGICLDGTDRRFDLASLVGVLRQAQDTGLVHWVGNPWDRAPR